MLLFFHSGDDLVRVCWLQFNNAITYFFSTLKARLVLCFFQFSCHTLCSVFCPRFPPRIRKPLHLQLARALGRALGRLLGLRVLDQRALRLVGRALLIAIYFGSDMSCYERNACVLHARCLLAHSSRCMSRVRHAWDFLTCVDVDEFQQVWHP